MTIIDYHNNIHHTTKSLRAPLQLWHGTEWQIFIASFMEVVEALTSIYKAILSVILQIINSSLSSPKKYIYI